MASNERFQFDSALFRRDVSSRLLDDAMAAWEDLQAWKRMNEAVRGHGASEAIQEHVLMKEARFAGLMNKVAEMHEKDCAEKLKRLSESPET